MAERILWSTEARADIRAIDRETALRLLKALDRFMKTEAGNVKQLEGFDPPLFRLRVGAWRFIYRRPATTPSKSSASATAKRPTGKARLKPLKSRISNTVTQVTRHLPKSTNQSSACQAHPARGGLSLNLSPAQPALPPLPIQPD